MFLKLHRAYETPSLGEGGGMLKMTSFWELAIYITLNRIPFTNYFSSKRDKEKIQTP